MESMIRNNSEIGRLKRVLLHRPGRELENLMPDYLERLLFDDIPFLAEAQREHDNFANCLRKEGVEVVYLADLAAESLISPEVRERFIAKFLDEADLQEENLKNAVRAYLEPMENRALVETMMAGIRQSDLPGNPPKRAGDYPFATDPMPNLYFTRDPFSTIGTGASIHRMHTETRNRETLFGRFIFKYHPQYQNTPLWCDGSEPTSLEGGDILVLSPEVLGVGISQRTQRESVENLARKVLTEGQTFKKILAFNIPKARSFMHLDTVFTMVDRGIFTIHPNILSSITVLVMELDENRKLTICEEDGCLEDILKKYLHLDSVKLIPCGSGNPVDAAREQWNDGSNTLAIGAGEVVVYSRNYVTNRSLEDAGIKIHVIPSSELSRGRGGPRCMSMPLWREDL